MSKRNVKLPGFPYTIGMTLSEDLQVGHSFGLSDILISATYGSKIIKYLNDFKHSEQFFTFRNQGDQMIWMRKHSNGPKWQPPSFY